METGTMFQRAALKPTQPCRHISPASEQLYSSSGSRATTLNSSSFESEASGMNSGSFCSSATSYSTGRTLFTPNADDHLFTDQRNNEPPDDRGYNDIPDHTGFEGKRDPGGDWGRSKHLSAPHNWWERDLDKRRQQLRDVKDKLEIRQATGMEGFDRRAGLSSVYVDGARPVPGKSISATVNPIDN